MAIAGLGSDAEIAGIIFEPFGRPRPRPRPLMTGQFSDPNIVSAAGPIDVNTLQAWAVPMRERPPRGRQPIARYYEPVVRPVTVKTDSAWQTPLVDVQGFRIWRGSPLPRLGAFSLHLGGILDDFAPLSAAEQGIVGLPGRLRRVQQGQGVQPLGLPGDSGEFLYVGLTTDPQRPTIRPRPVQTGTISGPELTETDAAFLSAVVSVPLGGPTPRGKLPPLGQVASGQWFDSLIVDRLFPWVQAPRPLPRPRPQPGQAVVPPTVKTDSANWTPLANPPVELPRAHAYLSRAAYPTTIDIGPIIGGAISPAVGGPYVVLVGQMFQGGAVVGFCRTE